MEIRIIGIADHRVNVDPDKYLEAKASGRLHQFMDPYIKSMPFEVTYAPAEAFE